MKLNQLLHESEQDVEDIDAVMHAAGFSNNYEIVHVNGQLCVDVHKTLTVPANWPSFPVQFNTITGNMLTLTSSIQRSFIGFPRNVTGNAFINGGPYTTSPGINAFEGFNPTITGGLSFAPKYPASLKGIHKTSKNLVVGGAVTVNDNVTNIVGLALIEGINKVNVVQNGLVPIKFDVSHHDIHEFQEQLLDAGLKAQARL